MYLNKYYIRAHLNDAIRQNQLCIIKILPKYVTVFSRQKNHRISWKKLAKRVTGILTNVIWQQ